MPLNDIFQFETVDGESKAIDDLIITPQSQALSVRWTHGGFVWNRPLAVLVERAGETERIPIIDVTRVAQLTLYGLAILFVMISIFLSVRRSK